MIYNKFWFVFLWFFLVVLVISYLLKPKKYFPIILPLKGSYAILSFFQKFLLFLIVLIVALIPFNIWIYQWIKIQKVPTLNIEVLFDVSLSMTAKDMQPDRFTLAKQSLIEFINSLDSNYNIWMITFSGIPFVYIPISDDKKALIWKISHMSMADFPPTLNFVWTAIWDAILLWVDQLVKYTHKKIQPWVLLLLTDGDSNKWVKVQDAIKYAKQHKIPIFVWAIWKDTKYIVGEDVYWNQVPTSINFELLKKIAKETWWAYQRIQSKEDFIKILSKLSNYVKTYEQVKKEYQYMYLNYYFYWILFVLLVLYLVLFVRFKVS